MERQYKDSGIEWIGRIPEDWEVVPFRSYVNERSEKNKGEKTHELLALSFALGVTLYKDKVFNMDRVKDNYEDYQLVYENDLVLSPNDIIKGSVFVSKYSGCISPMYFVFSARNVKKHYLPYLSYLLRTREAGKKFFFIARGLIGSLLDNGKYVTRRMTVSKQDLLKFKVLLPSLVEQHKIVEYLDKKCGEIDELIALQEKMIAQLTEYKQAVITEAVTKGLDPNAKLVPSGIEWIGDVPEGWEISRFKTLFSTGKGLNFTKAELVQEGVPVISYGQVHSKINSGTCISNQLIRFIPESLTEGGEASRVHIGDFIFADTSEDKEGCGNAVYIDKEIGIYAGYHTVVAFTKDRKYSPYLAYLFLTDKWRSQIRSKVTGIKVFSISQTILNQTSIILPPLPVQQRIATYLDTKCSEIDSLIALKRQKIESLNAYKKSVIYEAVTGKTII